METKTDLYFQNLFKKKITKENTLPRKKHPDTCKPQKKNVLGKKTMNTCFKLTATILSFNRFIS